MDWRSGIVWILLWAVLTRSYFEVHDIILFKTRRRPLSRYFGRCSDRHLFFEKNATFATIKVFHGAWSMPSEPRNCSFGSYWFLSVNTFSKASIASLLITRNPNNLTWTLGSGFRNWRSRQFVDDLCWVLETNLVKDRMPFFGTMPDLQQRTYLIIAVVLRTKNLCLPISQLLSVFTIRFFSYLMVRRRVLLVEQCMIF